MGFLPLGDLFPLQLPSESIDRGLFACFPRKFTTAEGKLLRLIDAKVKTQTIPVLPTSTKYRN